MADTSEDFIYVRERRLPYETFDADNHLYENRDALTKFLPREYEGVIKYVEVNGRTKLAIRDQISDYIPNPTFGKVAVPGRLRPRRQPITGKAAVGGSRPACKPKVMPGIDAFFDPEPRLALMKEMGIDRTLLWPTLASVLEERVADDPDVAVAVIHALNEWMHEHWSLRVLRRHLLHADHQPGRRDRPGPRGARVHPRARRQDLPDPGGAGADLEGPQVLRPAGVRSVLGSGCRTSTSSSACTPATPATSATSTSGRASANEMLPFKAHRRPRRSRRWRRRRTSCTTAMASIIGHGLATRFPKLKFMPVEFQSEWIRPFVKRIQDAYEKSPVLFDEDPFEVFNRNVYVHAFHEPDPKGLHRPGHPGRPPHVRLRLPPPRGHGRSAGLQRGRRGPDEEDQALIMGGTLEKALKVGKYADN